MNRTLMSAVVLSAATLAQLQSSAQPGSYRDRQAAEYKSLSNATQRAFSVPTSSYTPSSSSSSSSPYSQSSSTPSSSRSSYGSGTSSYYNAFDDGAAARRRAAYEARVEAQDKEWQEKVSKVRELLKSSGIVPSTPEAYTQFMMLANGQGLDEAAVHSLIQYDAASYNRAIARANGMNENYTGSTKKDCQGSCSETVTYVNGSGVYTGNTREGAPHGYGTIVLAGGQTITGRFYEGAVSGGKVTVKWPKEAGKETAAEYEGGYRDGEMNGYGIWKDGPDDIYEGEFKDSKLNGKCTLTRKTYVHTGTWKDNKETGKHVWVYKNGRIVEQDMDDPNSKEVVIAEGRSWAPPAGLKTYTTEAGTVYEGEAAVPGKPFKGKFTFKDGTISEGLHDKDGYILKGKVTYPSGYSFDGEFRNRQRYRGTYVYKFGTFNGQFDSTGVNFVVGRNIDPDGTVSEMFYGPKNTNLGYRRTKKPDGRIQEEIYTDDKTSTAIVYHRTFGDVFTGIVRGQEGYQMFGVLKGVDGKLQSAGLTNEARWSAVAPEEEAMAKLAAILAQKAVDKGRAAYNEAVKWNPALTLK